MGLLGQMGDLFPEKAQELDIRGDFYPRHYTLGQG
jgi:hypothetical protein